MFIQKTEERLEFKFDDPVTIKTLMVMQLLGLEGTPTLCPEAIDSRDDIGADFEFRPEL